MNVLVGDYIETGEFQSVRARNNLKTTPIIPQQNKQNNTATISKCTCKTTTVTNPQISKERVNTIIAEMQTAIEKAINHALQQIPVEYSHERTM